MMHAHAGRLAIAAALACLALGASAGVSVRSSSTDPAATPFPSDRFTVRDWHNNTFRRVSLPKPNCGASPAAALECADIDVINELDGFSTQPRITIPFTGPIDPNSVTDDTVYLVNLGDTLTLRGFGQRVGLNQLSWDTASNTLVAQPDELLQQHSRYLLVITNGVRDASGQRIEDDRDDHGRGHHEYDRDLRDSMRWGWHRNRVVAASLFTTQSITADLHKINHQLRRATPGPMNFMIGNGGSTRAVFPLTSLTSLTYNRQTGTAPSFSPLPLPLGALSIVGPTVGTVAYASYRSPDYLTSGKYIPPTPTLTGAPSPQGQADIVVQMFLPAGPKPAGGWPVAIYGHGFTDTSYGTTFTLPSVYASAGLATVSINVVGHGYGPQGTLDAVLANGASVKVPAGGRGIDQNGDGSIGNTEGSGADGLRNIISSRDALRQTTIDLMQLIRQIEAGVDVDGDGSVDLSPQRIYYSGQSFGGIYGTILMGTEPHLNAGVLNVPGGSITEIARISPAFRPLTALALQPRGLLNLPLAPPPAFPLQFNENMPLRDEPVRINTVPGAMAIQQALDRFQWVQQAGNPVSYAQHIRKQPLHGAAKPVLVQVAKGDVTVPNPTSSALVRAGGLQDRMVYFRNDLAFAANGATPKNPHTFLTNIASGGLAPTIAVGTQTQIATFFASNGVTVIDPDGAGPLFEVPIAGPLPETLNFIP
ncbi:MAG TPA: Ig-like domain-containing protein [Burkholderiaceae bacterium]|nr:Ig-like domain-containing protein [Burkholderiaceae bacterium]